MNCEQSSVLNKLSKWGKEIQKQDDELIAIARQGQRANNQPEITRAGSSSQQTKAQTPQPKKTQIYHEEKETDNKKKSGAPRSYEDWSKLDAKLKKAENCSDDDSAEDKKESAEERKNKGNEFFKKKKFELAIKEYTAAIKLDQSNAIYFNNRATAYFQISKFQEAEKDASMALKMDPRYTKAFIRRGLSREALGKLEAALNDFESANEIEKGIDLVNKKLKEIRSKLGIPANKIKNVYEENKQSFDNESQVPNIQLPGEEKRQPKIEIISESSLDKEHNTKIEEDSSKIKVVEEEINPIKVEEVKKPVKVEEVKKPVKVEEIKKPVQADNLNKENSNSIKQTENLSLNVISGIPWASLKETDYPIKLSTVSPEDINNSLRGDVTQQIIERILKTLSSFEPELAFQYLKNLSHNHLLRTILIGSKGRMLKEMVSSLISKIEISESDIKFIKDSWRIK